MVQRGSESRTINALRRGLSSKSLRHRSLLYWRWDRRCGDGWCCGLLNGGAHTCLPSGSVYGGVSGDCCGHMNCDLPGNVVNDKLVDLWVCAQHMVRPAVRAVESAARESEPLHGQRPMDLKSQLMNADFAYDCGTEISSGDGGVCVTTAQDLACPEAAGTRCYLGLACSFSRK